MVFRAKRRRKATNGEIGRDTFARRFVVDRTRDYLAIVYSGKYNGWADWISSDLTVDCLGLYCIKFIFILRALRAEIFLSPCSSHSRVRNSRFMIIEHILYGLKHEIR